MFDALRFRFKLSRLERMRRAIDKHYTKQIARLKNSGTDKDQIERLERESWMEHDSTVDEIHKAHTDYLVATANRLIIPVPRFDDEERWEESTFYGYRYLSSLALVNCAQLFAQKENHESTGF